jgi:hypothetical protein
MKFRYRLTLAELLDLNRSSLQQRVGGYVVVAMGVAQIGLAAYMAWPERSDRAFLPFAIGCCFLVLGLATPTIAGLGSWVLGRNLEISLDVNERDVCYSDSNGQRVLPWNSLAKWSSTRSLWVLEFEEVWFTLPKRCCEPDQWQTILRWVESGKIAAAGQN